MYSIFFNIQIHYDDTFNAATDDTTDYLDQMVTHMQTHFFHTSLGTQITLEVFSTYEEYFLHFNSNIGTYSRYLDHTPTILVIPGKRKLIPDLLKVQS